MKNFLNNLLSVLLCLGIAVLLVNYVNELAEPSAAEVVEISGQWNFSSGVSCSMAQFQSVNFQSNGFAFDGFGTQSHYANTLAYTYDPASALAMQTVYSSSGWAKEDYRTIDFGETPQAVSKEFYDWFTSNATKISAPPCR